MDTEQQGGSGRKRGKRDREPGARLDPRAPVAFVDSSAIVALVDRDDTTHAAAVEAYRSLVSSGYCLFTTNHVVVEVYDLLATGVGPAGGRGGGGGDRVGGGGEGRGGEEG